MANITVLHTNRFRIYFLLSPDRVICKKMSWKNMLFMKKKESFDIPMRKKRPLILICKSKIYIAHRKTITGHFELHYPMKKAHCFITWNHFAHLVVNPLKPELNPICYLLALLGAHHFLHVSRIRVKLLTFRLLMS